MNLQTTIKQTKLALLGAICCLAALQSGCAEQKTAYKDIAPQIPALQPGYARVYLYTISGRLVQSYQFYVDGKDAGKVNGNQCLYVDHPAGNCAVSAILEGTGLEDHVGFVLTSGETRYVQAQKDLTVTGKITLTAVNADQAKSDLERCEYVGPK